MSTLSVQKATPRCSLLYSLLESRFSSRRSKRAAKYPCSSLDDDVHKRRGRPSIRSNRCHVSWEWHQGLFQLVAVATTHGRERHVRCKWCSSEAGYVESRLLKRCSGGMREICICLLIPIHSVIGLWSKRSSTYSNAIGNIAFTILSISSICCGRNKRAALRAIRESLSFLHLHIFA